MPAVVDGTSPQELIPGPVLAAHLSWLTQRGHSHRTLRARRYALIRMAAQIGVPLLEATPADLRAWRAGLQVTSNSILGYVSHAKDFYAWAVREQLREDNPAAGLPVPRYIRGLPRPIGEDELMTAVSTAPPRVRPWLVLAGWAGLRAVECAFLQRENVYETGPAPSILIASGATKGHRERVVAMAGFVQAELRTYQRTREQIGMPRAGYLFPRWDGKGGPNDPQLISCLANRHLHACGISLPFHSCRHRYASQFYEFSGYDLRLLQEQMGHASPSTTAGYAAVNPRRAADIVNRLPAPARLQAVEAAQ